MRCECMCMSSYKLNKKIIHVCVSSEDEDKSCWGWAFQNPKTNHILVTGFNDFPFLNCKTLIKAKILC